MHVCSGVHSVSRRGQEGLLSPMQFANAEQLMEKKLTNDLHGSNTFKIESCIAEAPIAEAPCIAVAPSIQAFLCFKAISKGLLL